MVLSANSIMGRWKLPGLSWLFCPLVLSHVGRSFLPRALVVGRSLPAPWLFGVVLVCWESLMMLCRDFGCPNVLLCFCWSCFITIFWFTDGDWDPPCDFGDVPPIPKQFSVQSSLGILAVSRENLSSWSWGCRRIGAPRASLWWELPQSPTGENLKSWGIGRLKETRFWTYCSVLVIIHILFLEPGWSGFQYSRNPVFNYCCACVGYFFSCISSEEVHFW